MLVGGILADAPAAGSNGRKFYRDEREATMITAGNGPKKQAKVTADFLFCHRHDGR